MFGGLFQKACAKVAFVLSISRHRTIIDMSMYKSTENKSMDGAMKPMCAFPRALP